MSLICLFDRGVRNLTKMSDVVFLKTELI